MKKIKGYARVISKITKEIDIVTDIRIQNGFYSTRNVMGLKGKRINSKPEDFVLNLKHTWAFYPFKYFTVEYITKKEAFMELI
jgi:hypothetical protein